MQPFDLSCHHAAQRRSLRRHLGHRASSRLRVEWGCVDDGHVNGGHGVWRTKAIQASTRTLWLGVFGLCLALTPAQAQETTASATVDPKSAQRPLPRPPKMPDRFDLETVTTLLANVDKGHNASLLKVGYFTSRSKEAPPLPVEEGWQLLFSALAQERVGSKRWFVLQNLRATGQMLGNGGDPYEALTAYQEVFAQAENASDAGSLYSLQQSVNELVNSLLTSREATGYRASSQAQATLAQAWEAYQVLLRRRLDSRPIQPADPQIWMWAIRTSQSREKFIPLVEKTLQDPQAAQNYFTLRMASLVYHGVDTQRELQRLEQAKPLLPLENKVEVAFFYESLTEALEAQHQDEQVLAMQRERVQLTGTGRAKLLRYAAQAGLIEEVQALLGDLKALGHNPYEVNAAAQTLETLLQKEPQRYSGLDGQALALRAAYVTGLQGAPEIPSSRFQELTLRVALAQQNLALGDKAGAKVALTTPYQPKDLSDDRERMLFHQIQQLLLPLEHEPPNSDLLN